MGGGWRVRGAYGVGPLAAACALRAANCGAGAGVHIRWARQLARAWSAFWSWLE